MPRLVSRADLARLAKVSRPALTKQCQKALAPACDGDRVDLDHPAVQSFLAKHGAKSPVPARGPTKVTKRDVWVPDEQTETRETAPKRRAKPTARRRENEPLPPQPENAGTAEDLEHLAEVLRPLLDRFGTERGFRDWLLGLKDIEAIREKRLGNEETEGLLIPRDFVKTHIFGAIEGTNRRLLSDTPKTLCREIYALAKTGRPLEEAEGMARRLLGKQLESVKSKVSKALRNA